MLRIRLVTAVVVAVICTIGCNRGPSRIKPPEINPKSAAAEAMKLYDGNHDGSLDAAEAAKCPGIAAEFKTYDVDGNGKITQEEITARISELRKHGVGLTRLNCNVTVNGRGIENATVQFEPEPYLGAQIQAAEGVTNAHGMAQMAISADKLPADQQDLKAVHYGTYKVRITHPSVKLPARYNSETTLGYESRPGDPYASFDLKVP
jgi:hypothetical protein